MLLFVCAAVKAQVTVQPGGKVMTGNERPGDDPNDETTVNIFGLGSDAARAGSRMSFGDYGSSGNGGANVFIGEWLSTDTDRLHLHGKNGIDFTGLGAGNYHTMHLNAWGTLNVRGSVVSYSSYFSSDERLKENIVDLSDGLELVQVLKPKKYDFYQKPLDPEVEASLMNMQPQTDKEIAAYEQTQEALARIKAPKKDQYGLLAQDLEKVLPQLVEEDDEGYKAVNYVGLITVMIDAIQEQQDQIEVLQKEVEKLSKK